MDELEVRVHEEINDYNEKFYGLTVRQIIAILFVVGMNVPTYLFLQGKLNENLLQFLILFMATPQMFWGFIKIQNMNAERFVRYWWRNFFSFAKALEYKTDADIEESKKKKKTKQKNIKENTLSRAEVKLQRKQHKLELKEAKLTMKADKKARKEARLLVQAKGYFGMEEIEEEEQMFQSKGNDRKVKKQSLSDGITEDDLRLLQRFKALEALKEQEEEQNVEEKEDSEESKEQE